MGHHRRPVRSYCSSISALRTRRRPRESGEPSAQCAARDDHWHACVRSPLRVVDGRDLRARTVRRPRIDRGTVLRRDAGDHRCELGGQAIAFFAVVSGIRALNGLTLLVSEVPRAAAADGIFPRAFTRLTTRDAPWVGLLVSACLATALVVISELGEGGLSAFNTLILITGITSALPYFLSAMASFKLLLRDRKRPHPAALARDLGITVLAAAFSVWCVVGSGLLPVVLTVVLIAMGYVVYRFDQARRRRIKLSHCGSSCGHGWSGFPRVASRSAHPFHEVSHAARCPFCPPTVDDSRLLSEMTFT